MRIVNNVDNYLQNAVVPQNGKTVLSAKLGRNEGEGMQFLLQFDRAVSGVWFEISTLQDGQGHTLTDVECYRVQYMTHDSSRYAGNWHGTAQTSLGILPKGNYPRGLVPIEYSATLSFQDNRKSDIEKGMNQAYWITVWSDAAQQAGTYTGTVTVHYDDDAASFEIPVSVEIWDITIPQEPSYRTAFAQLDTIEWYREVQGARTINSTNKLQVLTDYYLFAQKYRINVTDPPSTVSVRTISSVDDAIKWWDEVKDIVSQPECTVFRVPRNAGQALGTITEVDRKLAELIQQAGLSHKAIYYSIDEQDGYADFIWNEMVARVNLLPGSVMVNTNINENYEGAVTCWCPKWGANDGTLPQASSVEWIRTKRASMTTALNQQQAVEVWWYGCLDPQPPAATYMLVDQLISARIIHWMQQDFGVQGELYYNMTNWMQDETGAPRNPWADPYTTSGLYAGDGQLILPGYAKIKSKEVVGDGYVNKPNTPVPTNTLEAIRDGFEDLEYFVLMEQKAETALQALGVSEYTVEDVMQTYYRQIYTPGVDRNLTAQYDHHNTELLQQMREILAQDLQRAGNTLVLVENTAANVRTVRVFTPTEQTVQYNGQSYAAQSVGNGFMYEIPIVRGEQLQQTVQIMVGDTVWQRILNYDDLTQYAFYPS